MNCSTCGTVSVVPRKNSAYNQYYGSYQRPAAPLATNQHDGYYQHPLITSLTSNQYNYSYGQPNPTPTTNYYNGSYQQASQTYPQPQVSAPPAQNNGYYWQQQQIAPQVSPPQVYGRKRAVLCGVSYLGQKSSLKGSLNDAMSMKKFLLNTMGFPNASIIVLTEEDLDTSRSPTRRNIEMALRWLVEGCQSGESLVFYYSGHASRAVDLSGDEMDGYDELLCPVDYKTEGKISDDEINATIVHPLPPGAKLHAISDTCFSGTIVDLPFMFRMNWQGAVWEDHRVQHNSYKGTNGGLAISISACDDHQNSGDTTYFTGESGGALTYSLIRAVEHEPNLTYGRLLNVMSKKISEAQQQLGKPPQMPQLSSSEKFDVFSRRFVL